MILHYRNTKTNQIDLAVFWDGKESTQMAFEKAVNKKFPHLEGIAKVLATKPDLTVGQYPLLVIDQPSRTTLKKNKYAVTETAVPPRQAYITNNKRGNFMVVPLDDFRKNHVPADSIEPLRKKYGKFSEFGHRIIKLALNMKDHKISADYAKSQLTEIFNKYSQAFSDLGLFISSNHLLNACDNWKDTQAVVNGGANMAVEICSTYWEAQTISR